MTGGDSSWLALHTNFTHYRRQNPLLRLPAVGDNTAMSKPFQFSMRRI
jgi:hypothetical protein